MLAHSDVRFLDDVAQLQGDNPFAICHVGFEALVWSPQRGMSLCVCCIFFLLIQFFTELTSSTTDKK